MACGRLDAQLQVVPRISEEPATDNFFANPVAHVKKPFSSTPD
jgi:hypothetical protein